MQPFKPKQNHKAVGEHSEAIIIAKLLEVGYHVFVPFGDNLRCDVVIEDADGKFWKIQCKTGWLEDDGACIVFKKVLIITQEQGKWDTARKIIEEKLIFSRPTAPILKISTLYLLIMFR